MVVAPAGGPHALIPRGPYIIVRLLPFVGHEPHYRVRSEVDGHERALLESQIRVVEPTPGETVILKTAGAGAGVSTRPRSGATRGKARGSV